MDDVMIGVDPHKRSHTATMLNGSAGELRRIKVGAGAGQVGELLAWAGDVEQRTWAVESAQGMGYLLAQQLVAAGEHVVDVPATLASRVRVLGSGQSTKTDPNDARSVAIAALHASALSVVKPADHREVCRLVVRRHGDLARWRNKLCCRLHALVAELVPGGISKEVVVSQARSLLEGIVPDGSAGWERHRQALELTSEIDQLDSMLVATRARVAAAVAASNTTVTDIFGVGPIIAAMLIGYSGDPTRFATASRYAAYTGTAPIEFLRRASRAPTVATRQPQAQPCPTHGRRHPDPSPPQPRARLLRPQTRTRPHPTRGAARPQAAAQRRCLATPRRRRPPHRRSMTNGPGQDT